MSSEPIIRKYLFAPPLPLKPNKRLGIGAGFLSAGCFGFVYFIVHATAGRLPATQITFFRALFAVVAVSPIAYSQRRLIFSVSAMSVWVRSVANALSILCLAWNLQHTSIGFANVLFNLAPIVVLLLGFATRAIPIGLLQTACMGFVVIGSCLCYGGATVTPSRTVWIIGLAGAVAAGIHYTMLERQSAGWSPAALIWPLSLISLPLMLTLKTGPWPGPSTQVIFPLLATGFLCLLGQYLVVVSMRHAGLAIGTALVPSAIGFSILVEFLNNRQVRPLALAGCLVYLLGLMPLMALRASGMSTTEKPALDAVV
jgi:drug/metabolite transporter (DMT)-like permease